jgi:hypothetical protein
MIGQASRDSDDPAEIQRVLEAYRKALNCWAGSSFRDNGGKIDDGYE